MVRRVLLGAAMPTARRVVPAITIALALASLALSGCFLVPGGGDGVLSFRLYRDIDEQTVEGNLLGGLLGTLIPVPIALEIDLEEETRARETGPAQHVYLEDLTLRITPTADSGGSDDFDFLDSIEIYVESRRADSELPRQLVAYRDPVPEGARSLELALEDVDLIDYVEEGAVLTATATGQTPLNDVTFDGRIELLVEVL